MEERCALIQWLTGALMEQELWEEQATEGMGQELWDQGRGYSTGSGKC